MAAKKVYYGEVLTAEDIQAHECPRCGAAPGVVCDRSKDKLPRERRDAIQVSGRSHQQRLWVAQGHDPADFGRLVRREAAGRNGRPHPPMAVPASRTVEQIAVGLVACPRHGAPKRAECPCGGACRDRVGLAASVAARRSKRGRRREVRPLTARQVTEQARLVRNHAAGTGPDGAVSEQIAALAEPGPVEGGTAGAPVQVLLGEVPDMDALLREARDEG